MNYKVGDTVILKSIRPNEWHPFGAMDKFLGNKVKISKLYDNGTHFMFNGHGGWVFNITDIIKKVNNKIKLYKYLINE